MPDTAKTDSEKLDSIAAHMDSLHKRLDTAEEERKADRAKLDAACTRMDASEEERKKADASRADAAKADAAKADAKEEEERKRADAATADAAKADAAKVEEERKRADAVRADAAAAGDVSKLRADIDALSRLVPAQVTPEVRQRLVGFQSKAERVAQAFGDMAGAPCAVNGESETDYRIRLLSKYKTLSKSYKDADLSKIQDAAVFTLIEDAIYKDALTEASNPTQVQPGILIPQKIRDAANREITRYVGDPNACWDQFNPPVRHVRKLQTPGSTRLQ